MAEQKQDGLLEHTYSGSVRIRDVALKTSLSFIASGRSGERGSGISVLAARHDDTHMIYSWLSTEGKITVYLLKISFSGKITLIA